MLLSGAVAVLRKDGVWGKIFLGGCFINRIIGYKIFSKYFLLIFKTQMQF